MRGNSFSIGMIFVIGGGALTAFHLFYLLRSAKTINKAPYRIAIVLLGGICISIGANLIAADIHDRVKS